MLKKKLKLHVKLGDKVIVITGKNKGLTGEIIKTFPKRQQVVVKGINTKTKHTKPRQKSEVGKLVVFEAPIDCSNVKIC
jgi:large subunit ribosomal protein L24